MFFVNTINGGNISGVELKLGEKSITKNSKGELIYLKQLDEVCTLVSGVSKTIGAKYDCKVDPSKDPYTFYVLSTPTNTDTSINLIMDSNIRTGGEPVKQANPTEAQKGIVAWYAPELTNIYGPITAMDYLQDATKNWTNVNELVVSNFDDCDYEGNCTSKDMSKTYNTYARMPYYNELASSNGNNNFLFDYLDNSYWSGTGTKPSNYVNVHGYLVATAYNYGGWSPTYFWHIDGSGKFRFQDSDLNVTLSWFGVRPVINLNI